MNLKLLFSFLLLTGLLSSYSQAGFDKKVFYDVLAENRLPNINEQLELLKSQPKYAAYEGALLMKKAGLTNINSEKLNLFKSGRTKLEEAIRKDTNSVELRFLRLLIQENSPKIVHYDQEIKQDALYIRKNYNKLQPIVQNALYDYSRKSKTLNPSDFKGIKHD